MRQILLAAGMAIALSGCGTGASGVTFEVGGEADTGTGADQADPGGPEESPDADMRLPDLGPDVPAEAEVSLPDAADVPWEPQPGEAGHACKSASDCNSGYCIETADGLQCTVECQEECPFDWQCLVYTPSLPDQIHICVPVLVDLCRPCNQNSECWTDGVNGGQACVSYDATGSFCGAACEKPGDCPEGYSCLPSKDVTAAVVSQCVLLAGQCPCFQRFIDDGAETSCFVENLLGKCTGTRKCEAGGLTDCSASVPSAEACNGQDDDCDGKTDEDAGGAECAISNDWGICKGVEKCAAGETSCIGEEAHPEICDGEDNNCNGQTDEGFPDTNGDGVKDCLVSDKDGDGWLDVVDNCPAQANPAQLDSDLDGDGDACDADDDNDQVADVDDCKPLDHDVYPGAPEVCNGKDDDCDYMADEGFPDSDSDKLADCAEDDDDNDGVIDAADCAPADPLSHPGAAELCDSKDNDCDGTTDEDLGTVTCGKGACLHTQPACAGGKPSVCDPLAGAAVEACDAVDNDCDGLTDEDLGIELCGLGVCLHSEPACKDGKPSVCDPVQGAADEQCDGLDNDCDGKVDEDVLTLACGKGECFHTMAGCVGGQVQACDPMEGAKTEVCDAADNDCDGLTDEGLGQVGCGKGACKHVQPLCVDGKWKVCDPYEGAAAESCDGLDNDCNGLVDDGFGKTTCGKGACLHTVDNCLAGKTQVCDPLEGAAEEGCDGDDNDCDGKTDEELPTLACGKGVCFHTQAACVGGVPQVCDPLQGQSDEACDNKDNDCDGLTDEDLGTVTCGKGVCQHTQPYCAAGKVSVCDPFLGVSLETCDGKDNDCDGLTDEDMLPLSCGLGLCAHTVPACVDAAPQTCDPLEGASKEVCDGKDNDCDGLIDEGLGLLTCGVGECLHTVAKCSDGEEQQCDPLEGASPEFCDGKDNDCDGTADPADSMGCLPYFLDADSDGYGVTGGHLCLCEPSPPYTALVGDDCDDGNPAVNPAAVETCATPADENCNGKVNEGCVYASCKAVLSANPAAVSGTYLIDPGGQQVNAYCDMTTDGGGWTLVATGSIVDDMTGLVGHRDAIINGSYTCGQQGTMDDSHDLISPLLYKLPGKELMAREGNHTGYWKTDSLCLEDHALGYWFGLGFAGQSYRKACTKILGAGSNDMWSTYDLRNNWGGHSNKIVIMLNEKDEPGNWAFIAHRTYTPEYLTLHLNLPGGATSEEGDQGFIVSDNNYSSDSSDAGWNGRAAGSSNEVGSYGTVPTAIHYFVR